MGSVWTLLVNCYSGKLKLSLGGGEEKKKRRQQMTSSSSSAAMRELQRELETKANDLSKLQKGKLSTHALILALILQSSSYFHYLLFLHFIWMQNPNIFVPLQTFQRITKSERSTLFNSARTSSSSRSLYLSPSVWLLRKGWKRKENRFQWRKPRIVEWRILFFVINWWFLFVLCLKELDLLKEDANVFKLIGPVLVKQDLAEANANVRKRIDYISAELYVHNTLLDNYCFHFIWNFIHILFHMTYLLYLPR